MKRGFRQVRKPLLLTEIRCADIIVVHEDVCRTGF